MKIFRGLNEYIALHNPVVTTGTFDGVHLGHQQIIQRTKREASRINGTDLLITFWPHPRQVIKHDSDIRLLSTIDEKIRIFEEKGVSNLLIIPFTEKFAKIEPHVFVNEVIVNLIKAKVMVVGYDHRFGHNRSGSFSFLKENEKTGDYQIVEVPAFDVNDFTVSSTKVRNALFTGNVDLANLFLGYKYSISGKVVEGMKLGEKIGFPTANIMIDHPYKLLPKDGVYICYIEVKNKQYQGMLNIGFNPTVSDKGWSFEVNILDFNENIYGENVRVDFLHRIRDEEKYENIDFLKAQILLDYRYTMEYFHRKTSINES